MLLTYIAQIRGKTAYLVIENLNLLDKMHEGLIVVSKSDLSLKFASRPAVRLFNSEGATSASDITTAGVDLKDFQNELFEPTETSIIYQKLESETLGNSKASRQKNSLE